MQTLDYGIPLDCLILRLPKKYLRAYLNGRLKSKVLVSRGLMTKITLSNTLTFLPKVKYPIFSRWWYQHNKRSFANLLTKLNLCPINTVSVRVTYVSKSARILVKGSITIQPCQPRKKHIKPKTKDPAIHPSPKAHRRVFLHKHVSKWL